MKNKKPNDLTLANLDPWVVDDYVKAQVGRNSLYKIKTMRSGSLLIEVDSISGPRVANSCFLKFDLFLFVNIFLPVMVPQPLSMQNYVWGAIFDAKLWGIKKSQIFT